MAKDYKSRSDKPQEKLTNWPLIFTFVTGLALGLAATIIYFLLSTGPQPEKEQDKPKPIAQAEPSVEIKEENKSETSDTSLDELSQKEEKNSDSDILDYKFHEILANKEINISEWETTEEEAPKTTEPEKLDESVAYIIQVASFKDISAADEVKAKLAILGIIANIQRVVINGQDVRHRVRIGPFTNSEKLNETRTKLQNNRFDYMLLKLKVGE